MSTLAELITLTRLSPEVDTTSISDVNLTILLNKGMIDLSLRGRALPKNIKLNAVANQQEYILSGASSLITDFLDIDLIGGGVLFNDGSRWLGSGKDGAADGPFEYKTKEWLDTNYPNWRSNAGVVTPLFWYLSSDANGNIVLGLVDKPSALGTANIWVHYLARGTLMTGSNNPWTNTATQLVHLEPYEILMVYYALEFINRVINHQDAAANLYKQVYEAGVTAMAGRMPLTDALAREGFKAPGYFGRFSGASRRG